MTAFSEKYHRRYFYEHLYIPWDKLYDNVAFLKIQIKFEYSNLTRLKFRFFKYREKSLYYITVDRNN